MGLRARRRGRAAERAAAAAQRIDQAGSAEEAVRRATRAAAGVGAPGILAPGLDEAAMYTIWFAMVSTVARRSGAGLTPAMVAKLVSAALGAVAAYSAGSKLLTWGVLISMQSIPGAVLPAAMAMNAGINALLTRRLGLACLARFAEPGFSGADVLLITRNLLAIPTLSEILGFRQDVAGDKGAS